MTTPEPDAALAATWRSLVEATTRRTAWTLRALATVDGTGAPSVRSIILRDCDPDAGTVAFATDARSAKVAEIGAQPRVALTFWTTAPACRSVSRGGRPWRTSTSAAGAGAAGASRRD
jgi:pyridoxine/pyridoxamine 5'-phosphate oxidase